MQLEQICCFCLNIQILFLKQKELDDFREIFAKITVLDDFYINKCRESLSKLLNVVKFRISAKMVKGIFVSYIENGDCKDFHK